MLWGESYHLTFGKGSKHRRGKLRAEAVAELNHFLRDWRTGDATRMDTALFDTLVQLHAATDADKRAPFTLICGYRSPRTNARLHQSSSSVASHSQHMEGKAVDINDPVPGM